jgi:hypothetical protein
MVHGTGRQDRKKDILWYSCHLKMECRAETMKFLLMDLLVQLKHHKALHSDHVVWRRDLMVPYLFAMIKKEESGK